MTELELKERKNEIFNNWTSMTQRDIDLDNLMKQAHEELAVGDGITINLWSDSHAYTVIKRTPSTITVQRDRAILDPNFKPQWILGGFVGHCVNQEDQTYTYERNENGEVLTLRFSKKHGRFMYLDRAVSIGRREFYDYNF